MPRSGVTKPERGGTSFDGEEPTELMAVPRAPQKTIEMRVEPPLEDEDGPLRKYLAPRLLPTQTVPEVAPAGDKIVINVKPAAEGAAAAEPKLDAERARRRAPTVRIERGTLAAQGMLPTRGPALTQPLDDGIDVSFGEAEADVARPSVRAIERPDPNAGSTNWKLVLGGVALLLAVVGAVGAVLVFTDTIELPGMARAPEPTAAEPDAAATAVPTASPTQTAQTSAAPPAPVETAAPSAASAVAPPSAAPARPPFQPKPRYTPPPRTNGRTNPTTI